MKKMIRYTIGFGCISAFMVTAGLALAEEVGAKDVTICSIIYSKDEVNHKRVRVDAYALTDMHMTMLYDSNSGGRGVSLFVPEKMRKDPEVVELVDSSFGPEAFDGNYQVWATFTGEVTVNKGARPEIVFILEDISDVKKKPKEH